MNKRTAAALIVGGTALILDSRCAAQSARDALDLCARTLVPSLFPLLVIAAALVPGLGAVCKPRAEKMESLYKRKQNIRLRNSSERFFDANPSRIHVQSAQKLRNLF